MITKCAQCGKRTVILYPDLWVYKRNDRNGIKHFCSWGCMRRFDKGEKGDFAKMEKAKRDRYELGMKVLELIRAGQSPIPYLKSQGYASPEQAYADIKKAVIRRSPEMADRFPKTIKGLSKQVETPEGEFVTVATKVPPEGVVKGPVTLDELVETFGDKGWTKLPKVETPETRPAEPLEFKIVGIEGQYGRFVYDKAHNEIIWSTEDGEAAAMSPTSWRIFAKQMPRVVELLLTGVEL